MAWTKVEAWMLTMMMSQIQAAIQMTKNPDVVAQTLDLASQPFNYLYISTSTAAAKPLPFSLSHSL
jgi:hypothetical protein